MGTPLEKYPNPSAEFVAKTVHSVPDNEQYGIGDIIATFVNPHTNAVVAELNKIWDKPNWRRTQKEKMIVEGVVGLAKEAHLQIERRAGNSPEEAERNFIGGGYPG
jgi:hypothetical protein